MFRVVCKRIGYPNGKLLEEKITNFDSIEDAERFAEACRYTTPSESRIAFIQEFKPGWITIE